MDRPEARDPATEPAELEDCVDCGRIQVSTDLVEGVCHVCLRDYPPGWPESVEDE